jgi:hypothetical protein
MDFDEFDRMVQSTRPSVVLLRSNVPDGVANEARRRCHRIIVIQERQWRPGPMYTVWGSAEELFAAGGLSISARDILSVAKRADGSYGYSPGETLTGLHTWMLAVHGSPFNRELRMMLQGAAQGAATRTGGSMTGTDCQACLAGEPTMGAPKGTKGQPSGACRNCSAFICEHHGQRDAGVPEFRCVQCDPKLLKASAVVIAQGTAGPDSATPQLRTAALGYQE